MVIRSYSSDSSDGNETEVTVFKHLNMMMEEPNSLEHYKNTKPTIELKYIDLMFNQDISIVDDNDDDSICSVSTMSSNVSVLQRISRNVANKEQLLQQFTNNNGYISPVNDLIDSSYISDTTSTAVPIPHSIVPCKSMDKRNDASRKQHNLLTGHSTVVDITNLNYDRYYSDKSIALKESMARGRSRARSSSRREPTSASSTFGSTSNRFGNPTTTITAMRSTSTTRNTTATTARTSNYNTTASRISSLSPTRNTSTPVVTNTAPLQTTTSTSITPNSSSKYRRSTSAPPRSVIDISTSNPQLAYLRRKDRETGVVKQYRSSTSSNGATATIASTTITPSSTNTFDSRFSKKQTQSSITTNTQRHQYGLSSYNTNGYPRTAATRTSLGSTIQSTNKSPLMSSSSIIRRYSAPSPQTNRDNKDIAALQNKSVATSVKTTPIKNNASPNTAVTKRTPNISDTLKKQISKSSSAKYSIPSPSKVMISSSNERNATTTTTTNKYNSRNSSSNNKNQINASTMIIPNNPYLKTHQQSLVKSPLSPYSVVGTKLLTSLISSTSKAYHDSSNKSDRSLIDKQMHNNSNKLNNKVYQNTTNTVHSSMNHKYPSKNTSPTLLVQLTPNHSTSSPTTEQLTTMPREYTPHKTCTLKTTTTTTGNNNSSNNNNNSNIRLEINEVVNLEQSQFQHPSSNSATSLIITSTPPCLTSSSSRLPSSSSSYMDTISAFMNRNNLIIHDNTTNNNNTNTQNHIITSRNITSPESTTTVGIQNPYSEDKQPFKILQLTEPSSIKNNVLNNNNYNNNHTANNIRESMNNNSFHQYSNFINNQRNSQFKKNDIASIEHNVNNNHNNLQQSNHILSSQYHHRNNSNQSDNVSTNPHDKQKHTHSLIETSPNFHRIAFINENLNDLSQSGIVASRLKALRDKGIKTIA